MHAWDKLLEINCVAISCGNILSLALWVTGNHVIKWSCHALLFPRNLHNYCFFVLWKMNISLLGTMKSTGVADTRAVATPRETYVKLPSWRVVWLLGPSWLMARATARTTALLRTTTPHPDWFRFPYLVNKATAAKGEYSIWMSYLNLHTLGPPAMFPHARLIAAVVCLELTLSCLSFTHTPFTRISSKVSRR